MIHHLDTLLFRLFRWKVNELTSDQQVRFQPPDEDWRKTVPNITDANNNAVNSLNVYLADLRENRRLRTNEREKTPDGSYVTPPPRRVDCHYLISAWSPVAVTQTMPNIEPTVDEHALLAEAAHVLGQHDPLDPAPIYAASGPNLLPIAVPPPLVDELLPVTLLPVEGFPKIAEFWGTMGDGHRWKPCVYAVITVPLKVSPVPAGPMVTTTITDMLRIDAPGSVETRFHIGGTVRDAATPPQPVGNAWVELLNNAASVRIQLTRTDRVGRFVFANVPAGTYQLRASAHPQGTTNLRPITVPEPTGSYDLSF